MTRSWATASRSGGTWHAERYSAAVTLYEMTLGAGVLPQWGDGKSDPALTDDELVIDAEKFDPSVREGLVEFFRKALHREPAKRFDNADEMRWAWQQVFKEAEQRKIKTPSGEEVDLSVSAGTGRTEDACRRPGPEHPCPQRPGAGGYPHRPRPAGASRSATST